MHKTRPSDHQTKHIYVYGSYIIYITPSLLSTRRPYYVLQADKVEMGLILLEKYATW
jgi:hypothetical protein